MQINKQTALRLTGQMAKLAPLFIRPLAEGIMLHNWLHNLLHCTAKEKILRTPEMSENCVLYSWSTT